MSHKGDADHHLNRSNPIVIATAERRTALCHIPGVWRRGAVFQYRVRVPVDLVPRLGKTHINRSLRTVDNREARRAALQIAIAMEDRFDELRGRVNDSHASHRVDLLRSFEKPKASKEITLSRAWAHYLDDPASGRSRKSRAAYDTVRRLVESVLDPALGLEQLTRQHCREVLEVLQGLPSNYEKRLPGLAPREAIIAARRSAMAPMSVANLNSYMEKFSGLLNWTVKEEYACRNPCKGLRVADPISAREKRHPFSKWQLDHIFRHSHFDLSIGLKSIPEPLDQSRRLITLTALYSGMRQNEICQLHVNDLAEFDGVFCFLLRSDHETGKRLKTASSERVVPVHDALFQAGLVEYHRQRKRAGDQRLWPELTLDRFGYASSNFSKWFARALKACGANAPKTCFHSLRHNFRDALRHAGVDREVAHALGGWTSTSAAASVGDTYGQGHRIKVLKAAIDRVRYDDVDALKWLHLSDVGLL